MPGANCQMSSLQGRSVKTGRRRIVGLALAVTRAEFGFDLAVDAAVGEFGGHANGVLDGIRVRRTVADDTHALDAEQRRAPVFGVVEALLEILERLAGEQGADLAGDGRVERFLQQRAHYLYHAFRDLQRDIPHKAVTDDD